LEFLLDQASSGIDFSQDDNRRQFLAKMLGVAARIPEAAARDQFADRIAHKARITEEVVRSEIRKAAVNRKTTVGAAELPSLGSLRDAEKALIWWLVNRPQEALEVLEDIDDADLENLATREIFQVARSLQNQPPELLPSTMIQRLSTMNAQLVTRIATGKAPPATVVLNCVHAFKRLRFDRERAAIQRQIDRLQEQGATQHGDEINDLWQRKKSLLHRIEELT
jgi:DNA primase